MAVLSMYHASYSQSRPAEVVTVKLKRRRAYKGHYIRPKRVMEALRWLQDNNHLYNDISICQNWETCWE